MRLALLTFLASATLTSGFVNPSYNNPRPQVSSLQSTAEGATQVPLVIAGTNIELTDSLTDYVNKRIAGNLNKLSSNGAIRECDVHLSVNKNPKVSQVILYCFYGLFVSVVFFGSRRGYWMPWFYSYERQISNFILTDVISMFLFIGQECPSRRSHSQLGGHYDPREKRNTGHVRIDWCGRSSLGKCCITLVVACLLSFYYKNENSTGVYGCCYSLWFLTLKKHLFLFPIVFSIVLNETFKSNLIFILFPKIESQAQKIQGTPTTRMARWW